MNPRTDAQSPATETLLDVKDGESFRQALQLLLTVAETRDVDISNQSWKCVSSETGATWDVEITTVEPESSPDW